MTFINYGLPSDGWDDAERAKLPNYAHTWADPSLYILADEELIQSSENAERKLCQIEKSPEPVIKPDLPWEGAVEPGMPVDTQQDPFYATVLWDPRDQIYRCWYRNFNRYLARLYNRGFANQSSELCYAVSSDGIEWDKPVIGQVLYNGSLENNMLRVIGDQDDAPSHHADALGSVIPIAMPTSDDRYACSIHSRFGDEIYERGITVCFSPDGINWRMHYPPVIPLDGDANSLSVDPVNGRYLITSRSSQHAHLAARWGRPWKRHIALGMSRDLLHWTPLKTVIEADENDPEDTQLYKMYIVPFGHCYVGYLLMFYAHEMVLDTQIAVSRDLMNWQRVGGRVPILPRGAEGSWDSKHVTITDNPPQPEDDRMRFWFGGADAPHYQAGYGAMGTGTLRRDGFMCYEAGKKEAVLTTMPFRVKGATWLTVNVDCGEGGEFAAEVIDDQGNPIELVTRKDCIPIKGNHTRALVTWKAGPGQFFDRGNFLRFWGQDVRYRFYMRNCKLYSFQSPNITFDFSK